MAQPYDFIALDVTLWDGDPSKFVRAWVRVDGTLMPYSPVELVHIGQGQYYKADPEIIFPLNTFHMTAVYEIFNDENFTQKSKSHAISSEHYVLDRPQVGGDPLLMEKLNEIISIVTSHDLNSQIVGEISEAFSLDGYVVEDDLVGWVKDEEVIVGYVTEETISGIITEDV